MIFKQDSIILPRDPNEDSSAGLVSKAVREAKDVLDNTGKLQQAKEQEALLNDKAKVAREDANKAKADYNNARKTEQDAINNADKATRAYQEALNNGNKAMQDYQDATGKGAKDTNAAKGRIDEDNDSDHGAGSAPQQQQQQAVKDINEAISGRGKEAWRDTTIGEVITAFQDLIDEFSDNTSTTASINAFFADFMDEMSSS